jgi:hypothetical protein
MVTLTICQFNRTYNNSSIFHLPMELDLDEEMLAQLEQAMLRAKQKKPKRQKKQPLF